LLGWEARRTRHTPKHGVSGLAPLCPASMQVAPVLAESFKPSPKPLGVAPEEAAWIALDEVLRRLVGRLCVAARGQSTQLDAQLGRVSSAIRKRSQATELEPLLGDLGRAISALDDAPVTAQRSSPANQAYVAAACYLVRLLERLSIDTSGQNKVAELKSLLSGATTDAALGDAIERMAELVNEQLQKFQRDKGEVERTLAQVNDQLDEVAAYLFGEDTDRAEAQQSTQKLDGEVREQLTQLDQCAQTTRELETLRADVARRSQAIHDHMGEFREREAQRQAAYAERAERMRLRIAELERETRTLHASLQREKRMSTTDALTGIPNRLAWDERVAHEFARWKRFRRPMCLVAWDIDNFKAINDSFGHAAGDKVLYVVAQHLARQVREIDFVARYGGEEFAMLLIGTRAEDALRVCNGLRERIAKLNFHFRQKPIPVTVSCGIAGFDGEDTIEGVFERADLAMYRAKREGRNACLVG
jgi:diguanylate cyclase